MSADKMPVYGSQKGTYDIPQKNPPIIVVATADPPIDHDTWSELGRPHWLVRWDVRTADKTIQRYTPTRVPTYCPLAVCCVVPMFTAKLAAGFYGLAPSRFKLFVPCNWLQVLDVLTALEHVQTRTAIPANLELPGQWLTGRDAQLYSPAPVEPDPVQRMADDGGPHAASEPSDSPACDHEEIGPPKPPRRARK